MARAARTATGEERRDRLGAARLYLVIESRVDGTGVEPVVAAALAGGVDVVQLRDKEASDEALLATAARLRALCDEHQALLMVNDRPELALACHADGVHVGQDDLAVADARRLAGPGALVGLSTHSPAQFDAAISARGEARADQLSVGPVWQTPTKPGRPAAGIELVAHAAAAGEEAAWFAIGGIDLDNIGAVFAAGARRVVVVRAIRDASDPREAAARLRAALDPASH